jgi:hypothetical protein
METRIAQRHDDEESRKKKLVEREDARTILAAGCSTSMRSRMVAPSLVIVTSPDSPWICNGCMEGGHERAESREPDGDEGGGGWGRESRPSIEARKVS